MFGKSSRRPGPSTGADRTCIRVIRRQNKIINFIFDFVHSDVFLKSDVFVATFEEQFIRPFNYEKDCLCRNRKTKRLFMLKQKDGLTDCDEQEMLWRNNLQK